MSYDMQWRVSRVTVADQKYLAARAGRRNADTWGAEIDGTAGNTDPSGPDGV